MMTCGRVCGMMAVVVLVGLGAGHSVGQPASAPPGQSTPPPPEKAGRPLEKPPADAPAPKPISDGGPEATKAADPRPANIRFGSPRPIAKPAGALRVCEYNVENLFDDKDDPALSGEFEDKDSTKSDAECKGVARALREIDADIVALEEVESKEALLWFRDKYLADLGYQHVASIDAGDERGIEQSVLSRYPIAEAKNWPKLPLGGTHPEKWGNGANRDAGKPILFHRSPLMVTVTVPPEVAQKFQSPDGKPVATGKPYTLTLFVVHEKSGAPGGYWREREAAKTVELVKEVQAADPERNIVILGDFNATAKDKSMQIFLDAGMIDLFAHRTRDPIYITHESGRAIDAILLSPSVEKELIKETRFILGTPARPAGANYRNTPGPEGYASDHYPVVMDLVPADR